MPILIKQQKRYHWLLLKPIHETQQVRCESFLQSSMFGSLQQNLSNNNLEKQFVAS